MIMYTSGTAITATVLPWIPNIWGMVVIRGFMGFCVGGQDTGNLQEIYMPCKQPITDYISVPRYCINYYNNI